MTRLTLRIGAYRDEHASGGIQLSRASALTLVIAALDSPAQPGLEVRSEQRRRREWRRTVLRLGEAIS